MGLRRPRDVPETCHPLDADVRVSAQPVQTLADLAASMRGRQRGATAAVIAFPESLTQ